MNLPGFDPTAPSLLPPQVLAQILPLAQAENAVETAPAGEGAIEGDTAVEAVEGVPADGAAPEGQAPPGWLQFISNPLVVLTVVMVVFIIFMGGGKRKQEKQRQELISSLTRGDRVTTIGGIIGNVVDANGDEVTLKIDETSNTKMKITRNAVANVAKAGETEKK